MRPKHYPYSRNKNVPKKKKTSSNLAQEHWAVQRALDTPKYPEHLSDVRDNIKFKNKLSNEILRFEINVIKNADTKDPAMVAAIAGLIKGVSTIVL